MLLFVCGNGTPESGADVKDGELLYIKVAVVMGSGVIVVVVGLGSGESGAPESAAPENEGEPGVALGSGERGTPE